MDKIKFKKYFVKYFHNYFHNESDDQDDDQDLISVRLKLVNQPYRGHPRNGLQFFGRYFEYAPPSSSM